jgi:hypothetical protein
MIAALRHRLIRAPARLIHHTDALILRLPPGHDLLAEVLARIRALPQRPDPANSAPNPLSGTTPPEATLGPSRCPHTRIG